MRFSYDLPFGARFGGPDGTSFRLWAPGEECIELVTGESVGAVTKAMARSADGWHETTVDCPPGTPYRFRLGKGLLVPDPASRRQAGDVHDASLVVDPSSYQWQHGDWRGRPWEEAVIYELHAGLCGGFAGVRRQLEGLADLGFTAIELMPIADFPGTRNWGYDGVLPYAPDSAYGTPEELKALIDEAHGLGLMVYLDVVYNHFGPDGNYLHAYAERAFRADIRTPWGAAIDFRESAVRQFFTHNALFWLMEYRFDGLRFDAVHAIHSDDFIDEIARAVRAAVEPGRHVHLMLENERNEACRLSGLFDAQWNDDWHNATHVVLTGETEGYYEDYACRPVDKLLRCLTEGFAYQGDPSIHHGGKPRGSASAELPPSAFIQFLQNHDQVGNRAFGERLTTLVNGEVLRAGVMLQLLSPSIPLVFMGEEVGSRTPFFFFTDHHDELADAVREGRRSEFARFAAFADPAMRERIPDPNDAGTFAASRPLPGPDAASWRAFYRELLHLRRRVIVPRLKGARAIGGASIGPQALWVTWRMGDGETLTLAANFGDADLAMPPAAGRRVHTSTGPVPAPGLLPARTALACYGSQP